MRPIYINGRFLTHRVTGTERYALELLQALDDLLDNESERCHVELLVPREVKDLPIYRNIAVTHTGHYSGRLWEQLELYIHSRRGVLFTPGGGSPLLHSRTAITIHDAAVFAAPQGYSRSFILWYGFLYRQLCRGARHVFTVSHFSKSELVRYSGAKPEKITVTYLGSEHAFRQEGSPQVLTRNRLTPGTYVLGVGSRNPNKNLIGLAKTGELLKGKGQELVLAGGMNAKVFNKSAEGFSLPRCLGYVSEAELRTLYENAACFVFPSFYEGFGLPPLEALSAGCPVVVSNANSLKEIFGEIGFLCDPLNPADIICRITEAIVTSTEDRESYKAFAHRFRWSTCAQQTWRILRELAAPN